MWYDLFLILLLIIIFGIDLVVRFHTWQSRIKIGRYQNNQIWQEKILERSQQWLRSTPTVKLTDNHRLIIIDILSGNYKRSAIQSWQEAALVLGLAEQVNRTNDRNIQRDIESFITSKTIESGKWKTKPTDSDHAILAYAFLNCDFIDQKKYRPAYEETWQMILSLKGKDGTVAYKNHVREYRFVDTIGFICPFLVSYGLKFDLKEAIDLAVKQITEYQKYGMMRTENIPCHTYNIHTKIPTGLYGWGRGLGWFAIGLIDTWKLLPANHEHKETLKNIIIETMKSVTKFQNENGSFNWLIFVEGARADSSTVATLSWFFTLASEIPEITDTCNTANQKCLAYLQSVTRRNGAIDFSQGDTKAIGVYSQNFDILPFTQGFVVRTISKYRFDQ